VLACCSPEDDDAVAAWHASAPEGGRDLWTVELDVPCAQVSVTADGDFRPPSKLQVETLMKPLKEAELRDVADR